MFWACFWGSGSSKGKLEKLRPAITYVLDSLSGCLPYVRSPLLRTPVGSSLVYTSYLDPEAQQRSHRLAQAPPREVMAPLGFIDPSSCLWGLLDLGR